jgi:pimeloyl-ACP methyl ester carboxylesterase
MRTLMSFDVTNVTSPDGRGLDVYWATNGAPTALIFHYGTPSSARPFVPALDALAERGVREVSFSRPGDGSSTRRADRSVADVADDVETVLDHIGADSCFVIGWSGGGPHALATAALLPDRVRGVALIGAVAPYPADGLDYMAGMGEENVEEFTAALAGLDALIPFKERAWKVFSSGRAATTGWCPLPMASGWRVTYRQRARTFCPSTAT